MKRPRVIPCLGLLAVAMLVSIPAAAAARARGERALGLFDREAFRQARLERAAQLRAEQVRAALASPLRVTAAPELLAAVAREDEPRWKVGVVVAVGGAVELRAGRPDLGAWRRDADGWVWSGVLELPGAFGTRLRFTDVSLPRGVTLDVYNEREAFGTYTGRGPGGAGDFWAHTVFGPRVIVQLTYRGEEGTRAAAATRLAIAEAGHLTERLSLAAMAGEETDALCSFNEDCVENASCSAIPGAIQYAQDAVASILFRSGGFFYICSGGLLADTDAATQVPYFLTANHCIRRASEAESMEAFFQFTTPCGGPCNDPGEPSTLGATIRRTDRDSDYTLLELAEPAPAGSSFLGWDADPIAFSNGAELFRISHPSGAPQAYSEHVVDTARPTCTGWPRGEWIYSSDTFGATEGGSSGSPVMDAQGEVVGQLSGACGFNVNDPCDAAANATVDGALAAYFADVEQFLDPSGGGGGGECLPQGASCTSDEECCSNKCRGPAGNKTCR